MNDNEINNPENNQATPDNTAIIEKLQAENQELTYKLEAATQQLTESQNEITALTTKVTELEAKIPVDSIEPVEETEQDLPKDPPSKAIEDRRNPSHRNPGRTA